MGTVWQVNVGRVIVTRDGLRITIQSQLGVQNLLNEDAVDLYEALKIVVENP